MQRIYEKLINDISKHAHADYPRESCGIITKDFKYIPCKNLSTNPTVSFLLDPIALLDYEYNTWGIVHSHPGEENPIPSDEDIQITVFDEYKFIVGFNDKFFIYWRHPKLDSLIYEPFEVKHLNDNYHFS